MSRKEYKTTEKNFDADKTQTVSLDAIVQEAEVEAAADEAATGNIDRQAAEEGTDEEEEIPYLAEFHKEYDFDGKTYRSLDLSGITDLTTVDGEKFDRIMAKLGHSPENKFKDITYTKHVAMHVTGLSVEFFNMLNIRDMLEITAVVYRYFLLG